MKAEARDDLTALIQEAREGSVSARDRLVLTAYEELHRIADRLMRGEGADHTLQPSALVNEAVIRLLESEAFAKADNPRYLLGAAAQAMRQVLIDHARKRDAAKRNGGGQRVPLDDVLASFELQQLDLLALNEALDHLATRSERPTLVVVLRFFVGFSVPEVAEILDVSIATVEGDWRFARAWLRNEMDESIG